MSLNFKFYWCLALIIGFSSQASERDLLFAENLLGKSVSLANDGSFLEKRKDFNWNFRGQSQISSEEFIKQSIFKDWTLQDNKGKEAKFFTNNSKDADIRIMRKALSEIKSPSTKMTKALESYSKTSSAEQRLKLYTAICEKRRAQRLAPMLKKFKSFYFTKHAIMGGSFYGYTEGQSDAQNESNFSPDSELVHFKMNGIYGKEEILLKDKTGVIRDPELSYDGQRMLFSWKKSHRKDDYSLYEMNLKTRKIRQLTSGIGMSDFEGRYLPNGDIIFSSTRGVSTIECWYTEASNIWRCDKDGNFIRRLGFDQVVTTYPTLLEDGRIVYTRWDYNDRGQTFPQPLFVMNPDGTNQTEFYGNNSWYPTTIGNAREIPSSGGRLLAVAHGHHTHQRGKLIIVDRRRGTQEAEGVQLVAPIRETKAVKVDALYQNGDQFAYPYPIDDNNFLVTYDPIGAGNRKYPRPYGIYFMDVDGNRELLVIDKKIHSTQAFPRMARKVPHRRPDAVDLRKQTAKVIMQDVYQGPGLEGIPRGSIKKLRVIEMKLRSAGVGQSTSHDNKSFAINSTPVAAGNGSWDVKKILGDVDVEEDGSAYFEVPARMPIYFQPLDKHGQALNTMRTWCTLMPNETLSCIGCHEEKYEAPQPQNSLALLKAAQKLKDFYGPARGFSYKNEIQPILDKKCASCHDGKKQKLDLTNKPYYAGKEKRKWTQSYVNLVDHFKHGGHTRSKHDGKYVKYLGAQSAPHLHKADEYLGAVNSPLIHLLRKGHKNVSMTTEEMEKLAAWVDMYVPYSGTYIEANTWNDAEKKKYAHFQAKRHYMREYDRISRQGLLAKKYGKWMTLPKDLEDEYLSFIRKHAPESEAHYYKLLKQYEAKVRNNYRNLASRLDASGQDQSYPLLSSNGQLVPMPSLEPQTEGLFASALNSTKNSAKPHIKPENAYSFNIKEESEAAWFKVELGEASVVDQVQLSFLNDASVKKAYLEFSDGSFEKLNVKKLYKDAKLDFKKREVTWVKLKLYPKDRSEIKLKDMQVWGKSVKSIIEVKQ